MNEREMKKKIHNIGKWMPSPGGKAEEMLSRLELKRMGRMKLRPRHGWGYRKNNPPPPPAE